jgi:hypothetical protein
MTQVFAGVGRRNVTINKTRGFGRWVFPKSGEEIRGHFLAVLSGRADVVDR